MKIEIVLKQALARKDAQRMDARAKSWPEKIATIERLRETAHSARSAMEQRKKKATAPA